MTSSIIIYGQYFVFKKYVIYNTCSLTNGLTAGMCSLNPCSLSCSLITAVRLARESKKKSSYPQSNSCIDLAGNNFSFLRKSFIGFLMNEMSGLGKNFNPSPINCDIF